MKRRQMGWGLVGGAATAFLLVRALRRGSPRERIIRRVDRYLDHLSEKDFVVKRRRGSGIRRVLFPAGMFLVSRWVISRVKERARVEQFNQVARQESRPSVRERARGPAEAFEQPSAPPFSENLRPEEKKAGQFSGIADDLKVIEGIGPAIATLLSSYGIRRFHDLAEADVSHLEIILRNAELSNISNPATWPQQARLAEEGRWDELHELQGKLKAGRRTA